MIVTDEEQMDRIGRTILSLSDGEARAVAIRRMCRNFRCEVTEDPDDSERRMLEVALVKKKEDFVSDYKQVGHSQPGEDLRTFGAPIVNITNE